MSDNSPNDVYDSSSGMIDLVDVISILKRQKWLIAGSILALLILGFIYTVFAKPVYQASATVQVSTNSGSLIEGSEVSRRIAASDINRHLQTQADIIVSQNMASRVVDKLGLDRNSDFLTKMGVSDTAASGKASRKELRVKAIDALKSGVSVQVPRSSRLLTISFKSQEHQLTKKVVNAFAAEAVRANAELSQSATNTARELLIEQIDEARANLQEAENAALVYARNARIIDASDAVTTDEGGPKSITAAMLLQSTTSASEAKSKRIAAEQKWVAARNSNLFSIPEVVSDNAIQNLIAERVKRQAEAQELSKRYKPDHPAAKQLSVQISALSSEINARANSIKRAIRQEYEIARRQEAALASNKAKLETETLAEQSRRVQLNLLTREVESSRTQYQGLLDRFKLINAASDIIENPITVIDTASIAEKVSPILLKILLFAGLGGIALGLALAVIRETLAGAINTPDDIKRVLKLPFFGATPMENEADILDNLLQDSKSKLSESYSAVRSAMESNFLKKGSGFTLALSSSQPGEGKSTSAIALADSFGRAGYSVLLIDSDIRKSAMTLSLGLPKGAGFSEILEEKIRAEKAIIPLEKFAFHMITSGHFPDDPASLISEQRIKAVLESLRSSYDIIIVDGPPILGLPDAIQIARSADYAVMVVQSSSVSTRAILSSIDRMRESGVTIDGSILTKYDSSQSGYADYYSYDYAKHDEP